jgi:proteasome beta subunit
VNLEFGDGIPLDQVTPAESFAALLRSRGLQPDWTSSGDGPHIEPPEATTVIAVRFADGVIVAGDRRATAGNLIAHRRVQKVFPADGYSAVAISGVAGIAVELTRLFQTELEHYEKIEGRRLSLEGKANHLASMVRRQLPMALQGLVVIPLFAGFDIDADEGKLFSFDVVGGRYDELDYTATGSGGRDAQLFLRTAYEPNMTREAALGLIVAALVAAAEEDTATGGPDIKRGIYPNVVVIDADGYSEVDEDQVATAAVAAMEATR